jgi:hypothetical protein
MNPVYRLPGSLGFHRTVMLLLFLIPQPQAQLGLLAATIDRLVMQLLQLDALGHPADPLIVNPLLRLLVDGTIRSGAGEGIGPRAKVFLDCWSSPWTPPPSSFRQRPVPLGGGPVMIKISPIG